MTNINVAITAIINQVIIEFLSRFKNYIIVLSITSSHTVITKNAIITIINISIVKMLLLLLYFN